MKAKEYLMQVGILDARLKTIDANIERIRKELYSLDDISLTSVWGDGQPHGTKIGDPTGTKASKLADASSKRKELLKRELINLEYKEIITRSQLWSKRMEVVEKLTQILKCDDPLSRTYYEILQLRYIDGCTWEQIAVNINYSFRHTVRLHGIALKRMEEVLHNEQ